MKVAVLSESSADEAAIRILIDAVRGEISQPVGALRLRSRGWPSVREILPKVLSHLHFHTDADALALVVDSNHKPPHRGTSPPGETCDPPCRMCALRVIAEQTLNQLRPVAGRSRLKLAIGLATPAIEAWYLCGIDPHVNEAAWINGLRSNQDPYTKGQLKQSVYLTDRPSLAVETRYAVESARRLAANIVSLERLFPNGFGSLVRDVRSW
jgi:hypothetical protein